MEDLKIIDLGLQPAPPKKTILVIDDEHAIHTLIFDILQEEYRLISAFNGIEGISKAEQFQPHLILMDMMMPDMNGYDAIRTLRRQTDTAHIPVVVITARHFDNSTIQLLKSEPNVIAFLGKPFRSPELRDIIRKALFS